MEEESDKSYYYCPAGPRNDHLIYKTHVANYLKDITVTVLSFIRCIYFVYVLVRVCRSSSTKRFFSRPFFMNWLPILYLLTSLSLLYAGSYELYWTV